MYYNSCFSYKYVYRLTIYKYYKYINIYRQIYMPTTHWHCFGSSSPPWFNVSLVFYLEACHKGVGFSSSLYQFSKWPATCSNSAIISIFRLHSLGSYMSHYFTVTFATYIIYLLLLISLLSSLKIYISLWSHLLTKVEA